MKYSSKLLDYFYHRRHAGCLNPDLAGVYQATAGNADKQECLELWVLYRDCIILQARFKAAGSVVLIAGGEYICQWLENKTRRDLLQLTSAMIFQELELSSLHTHSVHLIESAVKKISDDIITSEFSTQ